MNERLDLELAACQFFLGTYNEKHRTDFQIREQPDKPDLIAQDTTTGEVIGIEVMHLFYDSKEAKMLLGRLPNQPHGTMNIGELISRLNAELDKKIAKAYRYDFRGKLFLLIRVASPIFGMKDFDMFEDDIAIPAANPFAEIWLLHWNHATQAFSDIKQVQ